MSERTEGPMPENLPVRWPGAALDLGYHTRRLWSLLQSVWDQASEGLQYAEDSLVGVHHALLALEGRLNQAELAHSRTLLNRVDELQTEAFEFVNGMNIEILRTWNFKLNRDTGFFDLSGLPERTEQLLPGMIEERRGLWDSKMVSAWDELRLLSHQAVVANDVLTAWWEVGFRLADATTPNNRPGSPLDANDEGVATLDAAIERLPAAHQRNINTILHPPLEYQPRYTESLHEAYIACRKALSQSGADPLPTPPETDEFIPTEDYRGVRLGDREYTFTIMQSKMVKALHEALLAGKLGVPTKTLFSVAGSDRSDQRVQHVFRDHPALVDGLVVKIDGGLWRLNLNTHNTRQKPTS